MQSLPLVGRLSFCKESSHSSILWVLTFLLWYKVKEGTEMDWSNTEWAMIFHSHNSLINNHIKSMCKRGLVVRRLGINRHPSKHCLRRWKALSRMQVTYSYDTGWLRTFLQRVSWQGGNNGLKAMKSKVFCFSFHVQQHIFTSSRSSWKRSAWNAGKYPQGFPESATNLRFLLNFKRTRKNILFENFDYKL